MESEPALVPGIVFSDLVVREHGTGKLSLIGSFQGFMFPQFPVKYGRFFATASITNLRGSNEKKVVCRVEVTDSGHVLASAHGTIHQKDESVPMDPNDVIDMAFPFNDVVFTQMGKHSIVVLVDNEEIGRRYFFVRSTTTLNIK